jgi:uncharacterized protein YerC
LSQDGTAENQVLRHQQDAGLTTALQALPDRHRVVVYLAGLEGLGYEQISAVTGIPLGSVKSCLHRPEPGFAPNWATMRLVVRGREEARRVRMAA